MATIITGKRGTVKITEVDDVTINDTKDNTIYVVANKNGEVKGKNTFKFSANSGTDVIQGYDNIDSLDFNGATVVYSKTGAGKDLIINKNFDYDDEKYKDKITLKNYFASDDVSIGGVDINSLYISGSGKLNGTKYSDVIMGSKKADKITTGAGNDEINAGKGKDTITIDGSGKKDLIFVDGDGNDTVVMNNNTAEVKLDLSEKNDGIDEYTKSGNDLIITTF